MICSESMMLIKTDEALNSQLKKYNCSSIDELATVLWFDYGMTLFDDRDNAEYSQVNAQHSFDFHMEGETLSEFQDRVESKKIYDEL